MESLYQNPEFRNSQVNLMLALLTCYREISFFMLSFIE